MGTPFQGTPFDFIAADNAKEAQLEYFKRILDAVEEIVHFVRHHLVWNEDGKFLGYLKGSFNLSLIIGNNTTNDRVIIRFPIPGKIYGPWRDQKVKNEVMVIKYISQHTSIPVPRIRHWGLTKDSPQQLGPFIIEDFIEGDELGDLLKAPTEDEANPAILNPDIDEAKLNFVYEQIAGFLLELSQLSFQQIGAIANDNVSGEWVVTNPPLTYDMNEVTAFAGFPVNHFEGMAPFTRASDYFAARAQHLQENLETQRNVMDKDKEVTWKRYVARYSFGKLIPMYGTVDDNGPFRLFCDDLRPSNMLADPETMRITALIDFEFTNVMPAQFSYDLPWWLILGHPGILLSKDKRQFLDLFEPRKKQFIHAMEKVEARSNLSAEEPRLSVRMLESWDSGRFWFNLASRSSFDIDPIYWEALDREGLGETMLDTVQLAQKNEFLARKRAQLDAYLTER